ncbi:MAG: FAD-dependent monooxygenase, partial [Verrucomicrobiota bacterium]
MAQVLSMREITIIGGGLAGLSLGVALRERGVPVVLHEAMSYPRHRVCGEFISGVSDETLTELGISQELERAHRHHSTGWFTDNGCFYQADLPVAAYGISRHGLDLALAEKLAALGGVVHENSRLTPSHTEGVVLATGRPRNSESDWIGLKCHLTDYSAVCDLEMHIGSSGYLGICAVEDGRHNACALFRKRSGLKVSRTTALGVYLRANGLTEIADKVESAAVDQSSCIGVSSFAFGHQSEKGGEELRIGDQYAIISPFTGNGMSMALEGAVTALPQVESYARGELEWNQAVFR